MRDSGHRLDSSDPQILELLAARHFFALSKRCAQIVRDREQVDFGDLVEVCSEQAVAVFHLGSGPFYAAA